MRPAERFEAAVPLQRVDRTPVAPMIFFFAARHAGSSMETLVHDGKAAFAAIRRTFEDLGGWGVMPVPFGQADFPFLKRMVDELSARGIVSVLHFDSDWTGNLDYFQELPRASCILQLGGHLCLMGDVPAGLLAFGQPGEVAA